MSIDNRALAEGYQEIHAKCAEQGRVLHPGAAILACIDLARRVRSVRNSATPELSRLAARATSLENEKRLAALGIPTIEHNFTETEADAAEAVLDLSNHPQGREAVTHLARYSESVAPRVSVVLKGRLPEFPFGIGKGVRSFDPIILQRPKEKSSRMERRASSEKPMIQADEKSVERIKQGGRILSFYEGTRTREGRLGKPQPKLVESSLAHIQDDPSLPNKVVVKTASVTGTLPYSYESMAIPWKTTPIY